ncbi:peptidase inhibitor family I36 protein [Kitasatospora sp. NPDC096140]|uniref:peptidase inhibitor family I36 protein n=1 Tax=unclassified Kitasatospora TaxID=2633591 RepID=UPI0033200493
MSPIRTMSPVRTRPSVRTRLAAAAVAALAGASVLAAAPSASAGTAVTAVAGEPGLYRVTGPDALDSAWDLCKDGQTCFWQNANAGGWIWIVPYCGLNDVPDWFDDRASSVWNRGGGPADIYAGSDYSGFMGTVPRWWQGNLASAHNDRLSAVNVRCGS